MFLDCGQNTNFNLIDCKEIAQIQMENKQGFFFNSRGVDFHANWRLAMPSAGVVLRVWAVRSFACHKNIHFGCGL